MYKPVNPVSVSSDSYLVPITQIFLSVSLSFRWSGLGWRSKVWWYVMSS